MNKAINGVKFQQRTCCFFHERLTGDDVVTLINKIKAEDFDTMTGRYDILYCPKCDVGMTSPYPVENTVSELYLSRTSNSFDQGNNVFIETAKSFLGRLSLNEIKKESTVTFKRILDFGTGNGRMAIAASFVYPDAVVDSVDFHECAPALISQNAHRVGYYTIDDFFQSNTTYDLIILKCVLEHVHDPVGLLIRLRKCLALEGILWIEVPNLNAGCIKIFGKFSGSLYVPYHIFHFTENSLRYILRSAGYSCKIKKKEMPAMSDIMANVLRKRVNNFFRFMGALLFPLQIAIERFFNSSTLLTAFAKKDLSQEE